MKQNLQYDFNIDRDKNSITVKREFKAGRQLVWDCYTKSELLDQWFAPKPFTTKTKSMEFREDGHWHYAMIDPEGQEYWGYMKYKNIKPIDAYDTIDAFSDSEGNINSELPTAVWKVRFSDLQKNTMVDTLVKYNSLSDLEKVINMGMEEGLSTTLERLDELLEKLQ